MLEIEIKMTMKDDEEEETYFEADFHRVPVKPTVG